MVMGEGDRKITRSPKRKNRSNHQHDDGSDAVREAMQDLGNYVIGQFAKASLITVSIVSVATLSGFIISEYTDDDSYINLDLHGYINGVELDKALKSMDVDYKTLLRQITEKEISLHVSKSALITEKNQEDFTSPLANLKIKNDQIDAIISGIHHEITFQIGDDFRNAARQLPEEQMLGMLNSVHGQIINIVSDYIESEGYEAVCQQTKDQALSFRVSNPDQVWTHPKPAQN